jgi:pyrroline-5-carboxylate reductase
MIILFGCGIMGQVLLRGLLKNKKEKIAVIDLPNVVEGLQLIYRNENVLFTSDASQVLQQNPDCYVILAIKPNQLEELVSSYKLDSHLVISIVSGKPSEIYGKYGIKRVIRIMTNICCNVDAAPVILCPNKAIEEQDLKQVKSMFELLGEVLILPEESKFDVVTAMIGSGPAIGLEVVEGIALAGVKLGLSREISLKLAAYSILGSAKMILEKNDQPTHLRDKICTPGGCTIAGVESLEMDGLRGILMKAVKSIAGAFQS